MTWWLPQYEPSDHEREIDALYDTVDKGRRDFPAERTLILCFTNRCGSNYLGEVLASTGSVKPAREYLNHPMVRKQSTDRGIESFDSYLIDIAERFTHRGVLTMKAGLRQLYYITKLGFLEDLLKNPSFILIERDDVLAQAVSWAVALQTGRWKSTQDAPEVPLQYDFQTIDTRIDSILAENAAFKAFFARNDCNVELVRYEWLRSHPGEVVSELAQALELKHSTYRPERIRISPQRSPVNAAWKTRYLEELREI